MNRPSEADCQRTIVEAARLAQWLVHAERPALRQSGKWSTPVQGDPGFPDLVLVHERRRMLLFVELKRKPNRLTSGQTRWLMALQAAGVWAQALYVPEQMTELLTLLTAPSPTSEPSPPPSHPTL